MAKPKKCNPSKEVRKAGGILSNPNSSTKSKSKAGKILQKHQEKNH